MRALVRVAGAAASLLASVSFAQAPARPTPGPLVVPLDVALVRVDTVVTDKKGRHVLDLAAEDFEVYYRGARPLRREDVKRTIVFVVDDATMG